MAPHFDTENESGSDAGHAASTTPQADDTPEPQRRRSTVREPASFTNDTASSPAPTLPPPRPVISSTSEEGVAPKRGWWARRLMGGKD
jgi:hypothetical protein